jgi:hypothetical protein
MARFPYLYAPGTGWHSYKVEVKVYIATDGQSTSSSWCLAPYGAHDPILN